MKTIAASTLLSLALLCVPTAHAAIIDTFGTGTNSFSMTFEPIGKPFNLALNNGTINAIGMVGYHYSMGKYEVSRDMINKANAEGGLAITMWNWSFSGSPTLNGANRPATGISWNEAARFVNWLNASQGYSPAYKFDIQPSQPGYSVQANITLWLASDPGYNAANQFRNSQAKYFLPSMDEWFKAAYYDISLNNRNGGYWAYPTGSYSKPTAVSGGTAAGTAVYDQPFSQGPADIHNAGGLNPFLIMGMGGNVYELLETEVDRVNNDPSSNRIVRGGGWFTNHWELTGALHFAVHPQYDSLASEMGFRVASIPEPSSAVLLMLASLGLWQRRMRMS